jgi:PAS domain S-box-containing protein
MTQLLSHARAEDWDHDDAGPPIPAAPSPDRRDAWGRLGRRRRSPHVVILAIGLAAMGLHQVLPGRWHEVSYDAIEIYILLAMIWSIRRHRPPQAAPWWLLTVGVGLLVVGDVIYNALTRLTGAEVFPSVADALYLASYVVLSCGVISVLRRRRHRSDRTAMIDALLVSVASAAITWVYLIAPSDYIGVPLLNAVVSAAYPVGDLVLLAFLVRLLFAPGNQPPSERILALGMSLLLVADVAYARLALTEAYTVGSWLDAVYHGSYLCFAVAAAHPTMRALGDPEPGYSEKRRSRLWLLAAISLVLPLLAAFQVSAGHERNAITLAAASAAAFFLLTFRTGVLNAALAATLNREEDALRRERILRHLGTVLVGCQDRRAIFAAGVDHARQLAGDGADALLLFAGAGAALVATTYDRRPLPGTGLVLDRGLPPRVERLLLEGRAVVAAPDEEDELRALLPAVFIDRPLFVAPLFAGGRLRGALVVVPAGAGDPPSRLAAACEAVASAVSLALDAAELAERLVDERSELRFGAMVRNSSDIVLVVRADGTVRYLTPSVTRVLGWSVEDLLGRHITGLVHPDDASLVVAALDTAMTTPGTYGPFQCRYRHRDMSWRYLEAIGMSLLDDPAVDGVIVNVRDVTERVRLAESLKAGEDRLASQVAELQELHRVKNDFVATISHELRTPLTSMLGQLELLMDGDYGALVGDQPKAVAAIDRNSHRLLVLIEDLLTVARIESARLQLRRAPTDILSFVETVRGSVAPAASARPVTLHVDVEPSVGEADIDALQMDRALVNLLTNAVKFSRPEGRVDLTVRRAGDAIVFTVSDDGIGIPLEEQDQLFTRFFRSSLATNMAVQGSGLGLVITKSIVEEHGGTIELTSAEGRGTTVVVTVPASVDEAGDAARQSRTSPNVSP